MHITVTQVFVCDNKLVLRKNTVLNEVVSTCCYVEVGNEVVSTCCYVEVGKGLANPTTKAPR